jgi:hypothetical protein
MSSDFDLRGRMRRDFSRETITRRPAQTVPSAQSVPVPTKSMPHVQETHTKKKKQFRMLVVLAGGLLIIGFGAALYWAHSNAKPATVRITLVPKNIAQAVDFPVYYPDPAKLPAGYTLDLNSFSNPVKNGVAYKVGYGTGQKIVFSVQTKPADSELQSFNSNYIPLRIDVQTPVGQAAIGAYHSQTLASVPVINGPWIVITAPPDINQDQFKQVLNSLKAPN